MYIYSESVPTLFNDTIEKNIAYGDDEIDSEKVIESARRAGCIDFIENLPESFNSEIGDDGVFYQAVKDKGLPLHVLFIKIHLSLF